MTIFVKGPALAIILSSRTSIILATNKLVKVGLIWQMPTPRDDCGIAKDEGASQPAKEGSHITPRD